MYTCVGLLQVYNIANPRVKMLLEPEQSAIYIGVGCVRACSLV